MNASHDDTLQTYPSLTGWPHDSYIQPKLLYRLAISVCPHLDSYIKAERWFLSTSKPFDRDTRTASLFSDTKLRHPAFFFRMSPLDLSMKLRRASTLITAIRSMEAETELSCMLLNNTPKGAIPSSKSSPLFCETGMFKLSRTGWRQLQEAFFDLLPLLDIPRQRVNKLGNSDGKGKSSIVRKKDLDKIAPASIQHRVRASLNAEALPLSPLQEEYFHIYKSEPRKLFQWPATSKIRPNILSFGWQLLHHRLFLHLLPRCPLCDSPTPNMEHLFNKCKGIAALHPNSTPPLSSLLQPPYSNTQTTFALITCWAIWKTTWNSVDGSRRLNDVITKSMKRIIKEETHWMESAHPWI